MILPSTITSVSNSFRECNFEWIVIPKSLKIIEGQSFYLCPTTMITFYMGNEDEWNSVAISDKSTAINSNVYFYSNVQPENNGKYWHYVDGIPTIWD